MTTNILPHHAHHDDPSPKVIFGFWIYVLTDFILFASLFATYVVLQKNTYGGIGIAQIANLPYVLVQTIVLLVSSLTYGLSLIALHQNSRNKIIFWLSITFLLGLIFIGMDEHLFSQLIEHGNTWQTSGFLSAFFSLVGIHAIHVLAGLLWIMILSIQFLQKNITPTMKIRLTCLGLFWNFLNIVWAFIFAIVYLMGAV